MLETKKAILIKKRDNDLLKNEQKMFANNEHHKEKKKNMNSNNPLYTCNNAKKIEKFLAGKLLSEIFKDKSDSGKNTQLRILNLLWTMYFQNIHDVENEKNGSVGIKEIDEKLEKIRTEK